MEMTETATATSPIVNAATVSTTAVVEALAKKAIKPAAKPVAKKAIKPAAKPVAKKAIKPAAKPVTKKAIKSVTKKAIKPIAKKAIKPVAKPAKKTVEPMTERRTSLFSLVAKVKLEDLGAGQRAAIAKLLKDHGSATRAQLIEALPTVPPANISWHLSMMVAAGTVKKAAQK